MQTNVGDGGISQVDHVVFEGSPLFLETSSMIPK